MMDLMFESNINIVCYRFDPKGKTEAALKALNIEIILQLQETGIAAVSDTTVHGRHCLRVAINNHRTRRRGLDLLVSETVRLGQALV